MRRLCSSFFAMVLIVALMASTVSAATYRTFYITYDVDNSKARSMLSLINEFRTSGDGWYWNAFDTAKYYTGVLDAYSYDYDLEQIALQRAYEAAVLFDHSRPDGSLCTTCTYNGTSTHGECIAVRASSAAIAFEYLREDNYHFAGQGHRRAMLSEEFTAIGIAHVSYEGYDVWVQEYGYENSGAPYTDPIVGTRTGTVRADISNAEFRIEADTINAGCGVQIPLTDIQGCFKLDEYSPGLRIPYSELSNVTWTSNNTNVARIINNTTLETVSIGTAQLSLSAVFNGRTYTATVPVNVNRISVTLADVKITVPDCSYSMRPVFPEPVITYMNKTLVKDVDYTLDYSNNTNPSTSSSKGQINVTGIGNYIGSRVVYFTISKRDINDCTFAQVPEYTYTGRAIKPTVDGNVTFDGMELTYNTDYTYKYSNNVNAGNRATITLTGKGNFTGTKTIYFTINPIDFTGVATISPIESQELAGSAARPDVTVTYKSKTLVKDSDYTLSYLNNTAPGTGTVIVTGTGNYSGTVSAEFEITGNSVITGWIKEDGVWHYYNEIGQLESGWIYIDGIYYYLDPDNNNAMTTGWLQIGGKWYFFNASGAMQKGWLSRGRNWYYLDGSGAQVFSWKKIDGKWYFFDRTSGAMVTGGWKKIDNTWYYFRDSGSIAVGWERIEGKYYYFNSNGEMQKGWIKDSGKWYYMDSSGAMVTGWKYINKVWYYFNSSGAMLADTTAAIDGKQYTFDANGKCLNP